MPGWLTNGSPIIDKAYSRYLVLAQ